MSDGDRSLASGWRALFTRSFWRQCWAFIRGRDWNDLDLGDDV